MAALRPIPLPKENVIQPGGEMPDTTIGPHLPGLDDAIGTGGGPGNPYPDDPGGDAGPKSRSGETPRERDKTQNPGDGVGGTTSTPTRPDVPTSGAGSTTILRSPGDTGGTDTGTGVQPFSPMQSGEVGISSPSMRGLFGGSRGLTGGGLGVPLDPTSNQMDGGIDGLIQMLMQKMGRQ